jgi:hypothetical protein
MKEMARVGNLAAEKKAAQKSAEDLYREWRNELDIRFGKMAK